MFTTIKLINKKGEEITSKYIGYNILNKLNTVIRLKIKNELLSYYFLSLIFDDFNADNYDLDLITIANNKIAELLQYEKISDTIEIYYENKIYISNYINIEDYIVTINRLKNKDTKAFDKLLVKLFEGIMPESNIIALKSQNKALYDEKIEELRYMINELMEEMAGNKNETTENKNIKGGLLENLYECMFKNFGVLPSEINKQKAKDVFKLLKTLNEKQEEEKMKQLQNTDSTLANFFNM